MVERLKRINKYLTDTGETVAGLVISLTVVLLMLFPGLVFSIVLLGFLSTMLGEPIFSWTPGELKEMAGLVILSVASWYLGIGLGKYIKVT